MLCGALCVPACPASTAILGPRHPRHSLRGRSACLCVVANGTGCAGLIRGELCALWHGSQSQADDDPGSPLPSSAAEDVEAANILDGAEQVEGLEVMNSAEHLNAAPDERDSEGSNLCAKGSDSKSEETALRNDPKDDL